jgi:hypothetical protein
MDDRPTVTGRVYLYRAQARPRGLATKPRESKDKSHWGVLYRVKQA